MQATAKRQIQLVEHLADGSWRRTVLDGAHLQPALPGARYAVIDLATGAAPKGLVLKQKGSTLVVDLEGTDADVEITGFYAVPEAAFLPEARVDATQAGAALGGTVVTAATPVQAASGAAGTVWSAGDDTSAGAVPLHVALGGLGLAGAAVTFGGSDAGAAPVARSLVTGTVVGGPVVSGNGLAVEVFQADGVTRLGEAKVAADGSFTVDVGAYTGVVIARVVDADDGADYLDESTAAGKDLNATLFSSTVVSVPNSTVVININVLTTLAHQTAVDNAGGAPLTAAAVNDANQAIAQLFGLDALQDVAVAPTNGGGYDAGDGLSQGELYGAVLAALSGADAANGGDSQQTIDTLLAGLTVTGGQATLDAATQAVVVAGAERAAVDTGSALEGGLAVIVDTFAPSIGSAGTADAVDEGSVAPHVVYTATAADASTVRWSLKAVDDHALFSIDPATGAVTLIGSPDHETQASYGFTVVATDAAGNRSEQAVSLSVNDRDEVAPTVTSGGTATAINENSGAGQVVYTATSTDSGDVATGSTSYSLKATGDHALFTINAATGAVTLTGNPDHETKASYAFTVVATDAAGNATEQTVALAVNDLDEVAPTLTSGATATAIDENIGAGQVVYTATSTDAGDVSGGVSYSLKASGDHALFTINAATGAVTLTGNPDHETKPSYAFMVVATDAAGNATEQAVSLSVNDLDEVAPTLTSGAAATAIDENIGAGQVVYTATSTDAGDVSGGVSYSLKASGDHALFTINAATGAVTLTGNPDHETQAAYAFTVVATDAAGNASEQAVSLTVNDLDEVAPSFTSGATATAIAENSGAGQVVYTATSADTGDIATGSTSYSLKATGDHALFTINAATGAVTLTGNPDHETKASYAFTVVATDAAGNATEQTVALAVNDLDEVAPTVTSGATATAITENSGAGQVVYAATSTDAGDVSGGVSYSLKASGDHALFTINAATGAVTLTGNPDHETKASYAFTVVATDAAGNSSERAVTLAVNDLDEVAPTVTSSATATAIAESSGSGQVVYTATSTDAGDVSGGVSYSLKASGDHALFTINAATGAVTLTGNPDHETKASYAFTVVATDAAGNSSERAVTLAVNDLDEVAPTVTSGATATATDENSGAGQVVYTATSTDTGDVSGGVSYSLKAVDDHALFTINAATGAFTLTGNPDHETKSSYAFTVVATDAAGNATEQAVSLAVDDLDEVAPTVTSGATATAIDENSGAGQVVYTATSTDSGDVATGSTSYSLKTTGDHTLFTIDAATGAVTLTGSPDHETKSSYAFTVVATDAAGNSNERSVTLAVNDLDEVAPTITSSATATALDENSGAGQVVYIATSTDAGDVSGGVSYSLKASGDHALFTINAATGAVTLTGNPDHETQSAYAFTVVATDAAGNATEQAVSLTVNDLDEVAPSFTSGTTATAIAENSGAGQVVYTATSTDSGDVSGGVIYSLKAVGDHALFTINAATGAVTLTGNPDHETKPSYAFTVVATDAAGNAAEQAVSLAVNDLDEVAPTVTSGATAAAIDENSGAGQVVYTATSTDTGDVATGSTSYSLKATGDHALFTINAATGAVTLTGNPDHETQSAYAFTVVATDAAGNATEQAVSLAVNDFDEVAPTVTSGATATVVAENSGAGQVVYTASSTDTGDVATGSTSYSLKAVDDHALFSINAATGAVTLTGNPDHETQSAYAFTVVATDAAGNATEQAVSLAVNDFDEVAPTVTSGATATVVAENSGAGQVVYTASSTDTGDVATGSTSYSLKAVDDHALFSINAATGAVTLTGNPDHETQSAYAFTVVATDAAGNATEQAVTLAVNDLDESAPTVTSGGTASAIDENSGAGQVVYTATSTDAGDVSGGVGYSLKAVDDHALFTVNAATGAVTLTGSPDHETQASYAFTVVATDTAGNATEQAVTLSVNDLDEVAPTITSSATATAITENSGAGQVIYTATSTDSGDVATGSTSYSLKAVDDHAAFSIDASTGAVTLTGNPDHETQASYVFTVVATDAAGNASEQAVTLAINDISDETAPSVASIALSSATGALNSTLNAGDVVQVTVTMDEATVVDTTGGVPRVALTIDSSTFYASYASGSGSTALVFEYTVQSGDTDANGIAIGANALQLNGGTLRDAAGNAASIGHGAVGDNAGYLVDTTAPGFSSGGTATAIDENSGSGQVVYTAAASDAASLTYSLKATGDHALFSINGSTGAVTLTGNPDHETKASYAFTVVATDPAGNASEQAVSLAINDLDDVAPGVSSVAISSASGAQNSRLNAGDVVNVTVTMNEATIVNTTGGTPRVALNVGGSTVYAGYASGSGSTALVFSYTVQSGDTDTNGIAIGANALQLNGGTLQDAAGNNATLTHASVADNASYLVDTTGPTLSSSTPADNATAVAVGSNIVLNFGETVLAGSGSIVISNGAGDTRTISATDSSQVAVSGGTVTINPTADLNAGTGYNVQLASGVLTDQAGNAYAGISTSTALNFTTASALDTSVVVFDLVEGTSSSHSGRTFASGTAYTIYIRVDSSSDVLSADGNGPGAADSWGMWNGANNLGTDDRVVLVGSGSAVLGSFGNSVDGFLAGGGYNVWQTVVTDAAFLSDSGNFIRIANGSARQQDLWNGFWTSNPNQGSTIGNVYRTAMPPLILTSQGLK